MPLIAILDDRLTNRNIYARLARSIAEDAEVMALGDPLEALAWLETHDADLVVTDFKMPNLDGAAFTRRLRALPGRQDVPVMVITAYDDRSFRLQALEAGATDFLQSPVDHAEFLTRSRNLLRMHAQHRLIHARALGLEKALASSVLSHEKLVRDSAGALAQVIDTVPAYVSAADAAGRTVFVNALHTAETEHPAHALIPNADGPGPVFDEDYHTRSRALDLLVFRSRRPLPAFEQEVGDRAGGRRVLLTTKSPLRDSTGAIGSVLTTSLDITRRKQLERHLQHVASHDGLTDLPNRRMLQERLPVMLDRSTRGGRMIALLLLDLDRFKQINDRLGHHAGDTLLRETAARLRGCAGPTDLVARMDGDQFAVLQGLIARPEDATAMAERILSSVNQPLSVDGQEISVGASIGISLSSDDAVDTTEMLRHADLAVHQAKNHGRDRIRFFQPDMDRRIRTTQRIQRELQHALGNDELVLHYQPQMDLRTSRVQGVESLLRWNHPTRGLLMPGEFLPIAEESGMMAEIDAWVLRRACSEATVWRRAGFDDVRVGVNISPVRISTHRTRGAIATSLAESGLDPSLLEIELTERDLVADLDGAAQALHELRDLGVRMAIDDFGIGYSFLGHVKTLPVDRIKIDQSFVRGLLDDQGDAAIIRAVVAMAHGLKLSVLAEGVESVEQLTQLAVEGCDEIQGFYFSRPLSLRDLLARLAENRDDVQVSAA